MTDWNVAREWISALSGYVGAGGALLAAWLTIRKMRDQIEIGQQQVAEAKRQTDFALGDAMPDCAIGHNRSRSDEFGMIDVTVYNWNRRTAHIVSFADGNGSDFRASAVGVEQTPGMGMNNTWDPRTGRIFPRAILPGWVDRSQPPASIQVRVQTEAPLNREGIYRMELRGYVEDAYSTEFVRSLAIQHPLIWLG